MPQWDLLAGKKANRKFRKIQTILRTIQMIHVMNVVCGFELREEEIQFYIWLKEISTSETGRHRPPLLCISPHKYICPCAVFAFVKYLWTKGRFSQEKM